MASPDQPRQWGPPERVLGATVAIDFLLAESDAGAVQIRHLTAFPSGFEFGVLAVAVVGEGVDVLDPMFGMAGLRRHLEGSAEESFKAVLQLTVTYADGFTLESAGQRDGASRGSGAQLRRGHAGASRSADLWTAHATFWAQPLPPPGDLTFAATWRSYGVEDARHSVDAAALIEASRRAVPILSRRPDV